jgi:hypothetical protein
MHFRCGDSSFATNTALNPECYVNGTWKGTSFLEDLSLDSPLDFAACGRQVMQSARQVVKTPAIAYISSDYAPSASQISTYLDTINAVIPPAACHLESTVSNQMCMLQTIVSWFVLALSDSLIVQKMEPPKKGPMVYAPVSAFSRHAAMYGLISGGSFRYAASCLPVGTAELGLTDHGNWVCDVITP